MEEFVDKIQQEMSKFDREYLRKIQVNIMRQKSQILNDA